MKALAILSLTVLGFWLLTIKWGILSVLCGVGVWKLIDSDRNGAAIEGLSAWLFGFAVLGIILMVLGF